MTEHCDRGLLALAVFVVWAGIAVASASGGGSTVYSQPTNYVGATASQNDTASGMGNFATAYDDFTLTGNPQGFDITNVDWVGSYFGGSPGTITGFTIDFYANAAGIPGTLLYSSGDIAGNAGQAFLQTDNAGNPAYQYALNIPAFFASNGTEYWMSIVPDLGYPPQWGWETGTGGDGVSYQCFNGNCSTNPNDLAFSLSTATPEPSSVLLLAPALLALGLLMVRKKMKLLKESVVAMVLMLVSMGSAHAQDPKSCSPAPCWTPLNNAPAVASIDDQQGVGILLQLRDGRVLTHSEQGQGSLNDGYTDLLILTPDVYGSYINGTWSTGGVNTVANAPGDLNPPNPYAFPSTYQPLYGTSVVLGPAVTSATTTIAGATGTNGCPAGVQCGQVLFEGGEYLSNSTAFTNEGEYGTYVPFTGQVYWTDNSPPGPTTENGQTTVWPQLGDNASSYLFDGKILEASCCNSKTALDQQWAIFNGPTAYTNPETGSWSLVTNNANGQSTTDESGLTLLTNGKVLIVDSKTATGCSVPTQGSEIYTVTNTATGQGTWACGPPVGATLYGPDAELGDLVMMYNNQVLLIGGSIPLTAIYDVPNNNWVAGPMTAVVPPTVTSGNAVQPGGGLDQADAPGAVEPNGKVLLMMSPGTPANTFIGPCYFVEYTPTGFGTGTFSGITAQTGEIPQPSDCAATNNAIESYYGDLMILPTGGILFTDYDLTVEIYTPTPGVATFTSDCPNPINNNTCTSANYTGPTVASIPAQITLPSTILYAGSQNNLVYGRQLHGLTQNNYYGDDKQSATNFPLARLTCLNIPNNTCSSNYVVYAFTHDDGPSGATVTSIAPGQSGYTHFDLPAACSLPGTPSCLVPGAYRFETVTNGIPSNPINVNVRP